jgi:hypothetical protein
VLHQLVALGQGEQPQHLLGGGMRALALLGVDGQLLDALARQGAAQLAFDEGLNQQRDRIQREQRLDAALVLEEHRGDLVDSLDLLEALFDHRLALVGLQHLRGAELPVVGHQRVHAIAQRTVRCNRWLASGIMLA